jgi:hypothetical protein
MARRIRSQFLIAGVRELRVVRGARGRTGNLMFGCMWKGKQQKQTHGGNLCGFIVCLTFVIGY